MKITEKEVDILKKSLEFISFFPETLNISPEEYLKIHNRNIEVLTKIALIRNSKYIEKKINEYDDITLFEIEEFIKWKKKDISIIDLVFGRFISILIGIFKNKGNTRTEIAQKLNKISKINTNLKDIIDNPYLEKIFP